MSERKQVVVGPRVVRKQAVHASVTLACPNCQAPGVYKGDERVKAGWPACYDPSRVDQLVGEICPQCGMHRPADKQLGQIWSREYVSASTGEKVWQSLKSNLLSITSRMFPQGQR